MAVRSKIFLVVVAAFLSVLALSFSVAPSVPLSAGRVAYAVGLAVQPSELNLEFGAAGVAEGVLTIRNISAEKTLFEIYPEESGEYIKVSPASFALEAGEYKEVSVRIREADLPGGRLATNLAVTAVPAAGDGFKAGAGVRVPLRAEDPAASSMLFVVVLLLVVAVMTAAGWIVGEKNIRQKSE